MKFSFQRFPVLRKSTFALAALALCQSAFAVQPFTVRDIRVEGIQRTEAGTVFSYLPLRVGDVFNDEKSTAAIKALYATGFFKDVRIEVEGDVLVVLLDERPAIAGVDFTGMKEFEKDTLTKALKDIGVAESRIFDKASVDRAEQELKRQYLSRGLYGVKITTTITPLERNRVDISFIVDEGEAARIRQINFIGNKSFKDSELRDQISLSTPGLMTWYSKADQYSKQKLTADIESLRSFYLNRGYLEMNIESTQVSISPDKKDIYITINLAEGEKYNVAGVNFEGEMFGRESELRALMRLKAGDVFSGEKLTESTKAISDRLGTFGYAFANVNANPDINREKKEVTFTVQVDPGKRVYVRRINIGGNTKTRDEVIRREFRQFESSWYDGNKIKASRDRVDRLGYFKEVNIETPEVPGTPDQVDVNLSVVERPTGNFLIGAGYSQADKLTLSGSVQQANFAGSGKTVGIDINTSKANRTVSFSQTDPYWTDDGVIRSYDVYLRTTNPNTSSVGNYKIKTAGGKISFGVPFSEVDTVFFGIGYERNRVETDESSPLVYQNYTATFGNVYIDEFGFRHGLARVNSVPLTAAWQRDSRDSALTPSIGRYQRANLELDFVGNVKYWRATYQHQYYMPLPRKMTLAMNGEIDYGRGLRGKPYPVFKNFYAGGIGSVRGYETSTLGPRDVNGDAIGGAARIFGNLELQFPFPGSGTDRSLRWFAFVDAGNVFAEREKIRLQDLRASAGLGLSWISPFGPLKLSYGKPLNAKPTDRLQRFQFQIGSGF
ncbi:outer membrane protein assembly factor BamA [Massilia sp. W12]|uniref:outer membrane protein assembly factor BamA n=1 Tax=Massilia sp. W12 TaxID=3126507 RepID=UPI0030D53B35